MRKQLKNTKLTLQKNISGTDIPIVLSANLQYVATNKHQCSKLVEKKWSKVDAKSQHFGKITKNAKVHMNLFAQINVLVTQFSSTCGIIFYLFF